MTIEMKSSILGKIAVEVDERLLYVEKGAPDGGPMLVQLSDEPGR